MSSSLLIAPRASWLAVRGDHPGPVFVPRDPGADRSARLTGEAARRIVAALGRAAGLARVPRPHGLRHTAVTEAFGCRPGRAGRAEVPRHAKLETALIYDDNRLDVAGAIAAAVAGEDRRFSES